MEQELDLQGKEVVRGEKMAIYIYLWGCGDT